MSRVLLLSYAFPPNAAPEATLSVRGARELALTGATVDVAGAWPAPWQRSDHSLDDYVASTAAQVVRVRQPLWVPFVQPTRRTRRYPDALRFTNRRLLRALERLDLTQYDALLTWSQWHSVHLVGRALKRRHPGLRWVAHFSDLWSENPLRPLAGISELLARHDEAGVLQDADALTYTTAQARSVAVGHDPVLDAKAEVLPHSFDASLYPDIAHATGDTITVRYLGSFYGRRSPEHLFRGLAEVLARDPAALRGVRIELVGTVDRGMLATPLARSLPDGLVVSTAPVTYRESLALMRAADLLLVVDAPAEQNVFLASKVIDYFGARRPVLALTPQGIARDLVSELGGAVADPASPRAVADAILSGLSMAKSSRGNDWGNPVVRDRYAIDTVARRRAAVVLGDGQR